MKKIFIFLITILGINCLSILNVNAESFYEGSYIDNIYVTKEKGGTKYYQKARFFNQSGTGQFSYCVEPFAMFNENSQYKSSISADNLSIEQMERIKKIIYFGYQYGNHTDPKWYAITQYMVWQEADHNGKVYFTDSLNGTQIELFKDEIAEINNLIAKYEKKPSFCGKIVYAVKGKKIVLNDSNRVLHNFKTDNSQVVTSNNTLIVENLNEGDTTIEFNNEEKRHGRVPLFFNSQTSQNMVIVGDLTPIICPIKFKIKTTKVNITKVDKDNKSTTASGEASLAGAIYGLYDENNNKIKELVINKDMTASIDNLDYGNYYLKEIKPGIGYNLNDEIYRFKITTANQNIVIKTENSVIKKKVTIHKKYGENNDYKSEANISFDIFDSKGKLLDTITTNEEGVASIILPYGKYKIVQRNTTVGYTINDEKNITVNDADDLDFDMYDYKIVVPNTYSNSSLPFVFILMIGTIYVKKRIFS